MLYIECRYGFFDMDFFNFFHGRNEMKQLGLVCRLFLAYVLLVALMWWALPTGGLFLGIGILGFISILVLVYTSGSMKYDSLVISEMFFNPFIWFSLSFLNLMMVVCELPLVIGAYRDYDIVLVLQTPFLVFAAMVIMPTLLWFVAVSKLTPKPGTMVVDEDDLYYLPGEELSRFSPRAQIITSETKIRVSVLRNFATMDVTFSRSFCFAPWVFMQEARLKLPGSMNYSTLVKSAETEFLAEYPDMKYVRDAWKPIYFRPDKKENSPYVWNRDTTVSE